jgi:glycosyltransferase involved in cell wall biosynthesis
MTKLPLSVFIITLNEEHRIAQAINSVKEWVHDIIVVDSHSTDKTVEIAQSLGARVFLNEFKGYGPQKKYAESLSTTPLVLNLDADEWVSDDLRNEIIHLFKPFPSCNGYEMKVVNVFKNQQKPPLFSYGIYCLRLYDKTKASFSNSTVHDSVHFNNKRENKGRLKSDIYHRSVVSISGLVQKMNEYSDAQAKESNKNVSIIRVLFEFPLSFIKFYFIRRYCFQGIYGFVLAVIYAFQRFLRIVKILEKKL